MILDKRADLGHGDVKKLLFSLSVPTITSQIVNMLYNLVDRVFIGHMQPAETVGKLALTGVGVCLPLILIVSAFAALVASGGAPRASIYMGKQDHDTAEKILGGCFALQLAVSAVLTAVLLLWSRDLLLAFGASENTIGKGQIAVTGNVTDVDAVHDVVEHIYKLGDDRGDGQLPQKLADRFRA